MAAEPLQALAAALQACGADPPISAAAARAALDAANAAVQALLRLAADPAQHAAALDSAVGTFPFRGANAWSPARPAPGSRRRAGATAGPERCAARVQVAAVLSLLDAGLACVQARLPPPKAERGAHDRLEDTGLPLAVRAGAGGDAAQAGQATTAGIKALGACCSALTRLLRLATRRDHAQPAPQPRNIHTPEEITAAMEEDPWGASRYLPVQLDTVMDVVYNSAAVLRAPSPGKAPGRAHAVAWDACMGLLMVSGGVRKGLGSTYCALSPVLTFHANLCDRTAALCSAPPTEVAAWAAAMHRVLSLLTGPLLGRAKGVASGSCKAGPNTGFNSHRRCELLTRSAEVLRLLPALAEAASGAADSSANSEAAGSGTAGGAIGSRASSEEAESSSAAGSEAYDDSTMAGSAEFCEAGPEVLGTEQQVLEVGQMLVHLVARGCSSFDADIREEASKSVTYSDQHLPNFAQAHAALGLALRLEWARRQRSRQAGAASLRLPVTGRGGHSVMAQFEAAAAETKRLEKQLRSQASDRFLKEGATVIAPLRTEEGVASLTRELQGVDASRLTTQVIDIADEAAMEDWVAELRQRHPQGIDHAVSCFGSWWQKGHTTEQPLSELTGVFHSHVCTHFVFCKVGREASGVLLRRGIEDGGVRRCAAPRESEEGSAGRRQRRVAVAALYGLVMALQKEAVSNDSPVRINEMRIFSVIKRHDAPENTNFLGRPAHSNRKARALRLNPTLPVGWLAVSMALSAERHERLVVDDHLLIDTALQMPATAAPAASELVAARPLATWRLLQAVHLEVHAQRPSAADARERVAAATTAVRAALLGAGAGLEERHVSTAQISLQPQYRWVEETREQVQTGYECFQSLHVRIDGLTSAKLAAAVDAAVCDDLRIQCIRTSLSRAAQERALSEARRLAVADALAVARKLAEAAGVQPGAVLSLAEGDGGALPLEPLLGGAVGGSPAARAMAARAMAAAAAPMPVHVGRIYVNVDANAQDKAPSGAGGGSASSILPLALAALVVSALGIFLFSR
eukprot:scaffold2.g7170.t1